eukprot:6139918-Pyramimonas_sp.AAC.1
MARGAAKSVSPRTEGNNHVYPWDLGPKSSLKRAPYDAILWPFSSRDYSWPLSPPRAPGSSF